jgi:CheY-like chemotaxis protein
MSPSEPRILLVDDERDSESVFEMILEQEGYSVHAYFDPIEALLKFKPQYYDLIILDYRMEPMNGLSFIQEIRKLDRLVKAILITAWQPETIGSELQNWFIKVLQKPVSQEKLIEEIRLALKSMGPEMRNSYIKKNITTLKDKPIELFMVLGK